MIDNLFLCVGAQKAGTTWLNAQLNDHPEIGFSDVKEVHYFNTIHNGSILLTRRKAEHIKNILNNNQYAVERYFSNLSSGKDVDPGMHRLFSPVDNDWYISLFSANSKKYSADFTPEYALIGKPGFQDVKKVSRNQKIIFMMRDPVERALSAVRYFYKMNGEDITTKSLEDIQKLALSPLIIDMSSYHNTINDLKESFDDADVLYLYYEDVMNDKQGSLDHVTSFLSVESVTIPESRINKKVNSTESFDFTEETVDMIFDRLSETYNYVKDFVGNIPSGWRF